MSCSSVNSTVPFTSPFCSTGSSEVSSGEEGWTGLSVPFGNGDVGGDLALGDFALEDFGVPKSS
jgi:hypothetical protein